MKLLLYCTKAKPYLYKTEKPMIEKKFGDYHTQLNEAVLIENLNGKIVAECDFEVEKIKYEPLIVDSKIYYYYELETMFENKFYEKSCLTNEQLKDYLGDKNGYAIHIKNLHIFDKPKELGKALIYNFDTQYIIEKAPQNMMKVYNRAGECHILISIKPEWLCKILNGEKTIEVRKKVLKEMLK